VSPATTVSDTLEIELSGERMLLLAERAIFWPRRVTLFVSDLHWGKAAAFRAKSLPIPDGTAEEDLMRLDGLIARTGACRLIVLGDLLHATGSRTIALLERITAWRMQHPSLEIMLVRGNHDNAAGDPPAAWKIRCVDGPYLEEPFMLSHFPDVYAGGYTLAGHLHPGARLFGRGRQSVTLPCFWFSRKVGVLPAFSSFTSASPIRPYTGDRVYVVAESTVVAM